MSIGTELEPKYAAIVSRSAGDAIGSSTTFSTLRLHSSAGEEIAYQPPPPFWIGSLIRAMNLPMGFKLKSPCLPKIIDPDIGRASIGPRSAHFIINHILA